VGLSSYPAFLDTLQFRGVFILLEIGGLMKIFKLYLPLDLFNRIRLMAKYYKVSISKTMTQLLEIGYLEMIKQGGYDNEIRKKINDK